MTADKSRLYAAMRCIETALAEKRNMRSKLRRIREIVKEANRDLSNNSISGAR
jgi:hypothetical protein